MTTRLHLKFNKVYFMRHVSLGTTSILAPIGPDVSKDLREDTRFTMLRKGVTVPLGADLDSLKSDYLRSLQEDPERHKGNEEYEGY
jgi:hypothetical protein